MSVEATKPAAERGGRERSKLMASKKPDDDGPWWAEKLPSMGALLRRGHEVIGHIHNKEWAPRIARALNKELPGKKKG